MADSFNTGDLVYAIKLPVEATRPGVGTKTVMCRVVENRNGTVVVRTVNGGYLVETDRANLISAENVNKAR